MKPMARTITADANPHVPGFVSSGLRMGRTANTAPAMPMAKMPTNQGQEVSKMVPCGRTTNGNQSDQKSHRD